jgi:hypothetical protein
MFGSRYGFDQQLREYTDVYVYPIRTYGWFRRSDQRDVYRHELYSNDEQWYVYIFGECFI